MLIGFQAAFLRATGFEVADRNAAGEAGLAIFTVRAVTVGTAAAKAVLDQLIVDRHVKPQLRVGHQVTALPVVEIAARRFGGDVELQVARVHGFKFSV